ncbi:uncharacterized protein LOC101457903 [Ceratitis capitata]|uniref:(Mediterranean fruit fly) hypothetical protein n=1 Tax=Ceratitis capitata TaxID=7213 RepID=A0A811V2D7_CERCA|nr:uncharacterized protein LOC101457903 [Ceratitis capitata]CAD7004525.1 unnamed protein product [Ceratitis capitata]
MGNNAIFRISFCITLSVSINAKLFTNSSQGHYLTKNRCLNPPRTARRVENFIQECQEEVKNKILNEAFLILKDEAYKDYSTLDMNNYNMNLGGNSGTIESLRHVIQEPSSVHMPSAAPYPTGSPRPSIRRLLHGIQRIAHDPANAVYHPTIVSYEDKRIAGCLLHCIYARNNAIDKLGWPTLDGLVDFYSEGVNEHEFFMATLRSVNLCLHAITMKYRINRRKLPEHGESCDLAFDVFDCISDQITGYCFDQYN